MARRAPPRFPQHRHRLRLQRRESCDAASRSAPISGAPKLAMRSTRAGAISIPMVLPAPAPGGQTTRLTPSLRATCQACTGAAPPVPAARIPLARARVRDGDARRTGHVLVHHVMHAEGGAAGSTPSAPASRPSAPPPRWRRSASPRRGVSALRSPSARSASVTVGSPRHGRSRPARAARRCSPARPAGCRGRCAGQWSRLPRGRAAAPSRGAATSTPCRSGRRAAARSRGRPATGAAASSPP